MTDTERLDWIERRLFESHWGGTIGEPPLWTLVGHWRHVIARMAGTTFRDAIDAKMEPK